jgi:ankyrin repeat protein
MSNMMAEAIKTNDSKQVSRMLNANNIPVHQDIMNSSSQTGVILASQVGSVDVLDMFIDKNADLNAFDCMGFNALHYSSESGHTKFVQRLIEEGGVDKRTETIDENRFTALLLACKNGHPGVVNLLADDLEDLKTWHGLDRDTPLHLAVRGCHSSSLKRDIFGFKQTPEKSATRFKVVETILNKCGEDQQQLLNLKNAEGNLPLHEAVMFGDFESSKELLGIHFFGINEENRHSDTPLHYAARHNRQDILEFLLNSGKSDVNAQTRTGYAPLHEAAIAGNLSSVKLLVEKGALINIFNNNTRTPETEARRAQNFEIAKFLHGKNMSKKDQ